MEELTFRKATQQDVPFLIAAVRAAEQVQTGEAVSTYERIFNLSGDEFAGLLERTLSQGGSGHQVTYSTFFVLTQGDELVACCAAWIEAENGIASGFRAASAITHVLGLQRWNQSRAAIKAFADCSPRRTPGALQLETFYVDPRSRGQGITRRLIEGVLNSVRTEGRVPEVAEIILLNGNDEALRAYEKAGFSLHVKTNAEMPLFEQLTGSRGFLQLRKTLPPASTP